MRSFLGALHRHTAAIALAAGLLLSFAVTPVVYAQDSMRLNGAGVMGLGSPNGDFAIATDDLRVKVPGGYVRVNRDFDGEFWTFNRQWSGLGTPERYATYYRSIGAYFSCTVIDGVNSCDSTAQTGNTVQLPPPPERVSETRILNDDSLGAAPGPITQLARKGIVFTRSADGTTYTNSKYPRFVVRPQPVLALPPSAGPNAHPPAGKPGQPGGITTAVVDGYRWTDRSGQWIEYDGAGRITSYGDRNDVRVWTQYGGHGQVERVLDDNGRTVFTFLYSADGHFLTEARDHTPLDGSVRRVQYQYDDKGRLAAVADARGHVTRYGYGVPAQLNTQQPTASTFFKIVSVTDAAGRLTKLAYDPATARLARITAPDGGVTDLQYSYDKLRKEFSVIARLPETAAGRKTELRNYDIEGRLVFRAVNGKEVLSARGSRTSMSYTDERGNTVTVSRDSFDEVTGKQYPDGSRLSLTYDSGSLDLKQVVDEAGAVTRLEYDGKGNLQRLTAAAGASEQQVTEYSVNARGEPESVRRKGGANADGSIDVDAELQLDYDSNGNVRELVDGEGTHWRYEYDAQGNLTRSEDPLGHTWTYTYDEHGNRRSATDPNQQTVRYTYDETDRLLTVTDPREMVAQLEYDAAGRLRKLTDATGASVTHTYDAAGRLTSVADVLNHKAQFDYDAGDRLVAATDGEGNVTRLDYRDVDGLDHGGDLVTRVDYPTLQTLLRYNSRQAATQSVEMVDGQSRTRTLSYDPRGLVETSTNAYGKSATTGYDALGRATEGTDALQRRVTFAYDHRNNLRSATDALGHTMRFAYDRRDRLVEETNALGQATHYTYDDAGRLQMIERANGVRVMFEFDPGGRLLKRQSYRSDGSLELTDTFRWEPGDRLAGWTSGGAQGESEYDDAGRLLRETVMLDGVAMMRSYTYYANGQVQTYTGPDGVTVTYAYDGNGALDRVDLPNEGALSVIERKAGAPIKVALPGGTTQEVERDGELATTRLRVRTPAQTIAFEQTSDYGQEGELLTRTTQGQAVTFAYDDALRLRQANGGGRNETFELDAADNRTRDDQVTSTWQYDAANRLQQRGDISYAYDAVGNLIRKVDTSLPEPRRTTQYVYDGYNRLVEVRDGADATIARYVYDPFGYRIRKEVTATGAAETGATVGTRYFLQGEEGVLAEVAGDGRVLQSYGWQPGLAYGTAPLFLRANGSYYYYHLDAQGTPRALTDKTGQVVWQASRSSAFGEVTLASGATVEQPWRFAGQYYDVETGLHYNVHRYYDPQVGRYVTADPLGLLGGLNGYAYANADPINLIDPYGLWVERPDTGNWIADHTFGYIYSVTNGAYADWFFDGAAAVTDGLSFGVSRVVRDKLDLGSTNYCSNAYRIAEAATFVVGLASGASEVNAARRLGTFAHSKKGLSWWKASHKWGSAGSRIRRAQGIFDKTIELHHWLFEQRGLIGKWVPNFIKNHPWNLVPMEELAHDALHRLPWLRRTIEGAPEWARDTLKGLLPAAGAATNEVTMGCDCEN